MTVTRGKSNDGPKITMRVEQGRMVPVSAYDAELMAQWREGAVVEVTPTRPVQRPLEKKYFAMLTHLIRAADTPWTNVEAAHEALKLAAGFVTSYKKKSGHWGAHPRSITTLSDAELSEFFSIFEGIVRERFGIDPEELQRESPDTGLESSEPVAPNGVGLDGAPGTSPIPAGVGKLSSGANHPAPDGPKAGGNGLDLIPRDSLSSADGPRFTREEIEWLRVAARMLVAASAPGGDVDIVDRQAEAIKRYLTPETISSEAVEISHLIQRHCKAVCRKLQPLDKEWIAGLAHCNVSDLQPEAR